MIEEGSTAANRVCFSDKTHFHLNDLLKGDHMKEDQKILMRARHAHTIKTLICGFNTGETLFGPFLFRKLKSSYKNLALMCPHFEYFGLFINSIFMHKDGLPHRISDVITK